MGTESPRRPPWRILLTIASVALILGGIGLGMRRPQGQPQTISEVAREIRSIALAEPAGGLLGPWQIAAREIDPVNGELVGFRVDSGRMMIAARRATLVIDDVTDTFSFDLADVVYTRLPERDSTDERDQVDHFVQTSEHITLGPAPWNVDIVPDEALDEFPTGGLVDAN